jgi:phenylacetic acid degradation operon negative regulatory protein
VPGRASRERVRAGLGFLGYAPLSDSTWIGPAASPEVPGLLAAEEVGFVRFRAEDDDPAVRARDAWDLDGLGASYAAWHRAAAALVADPAAVLDGGRLDDPDERAFAVRSHLVHEWRKFLFTDPGLPAALLPADWPGHAAARFFDEQTARLLPAACRFVDACLAADTPGEIPEKSGAPA